MSITVIQGDITTQRVDAIVNAANASLLGGGGVDGAIHVAAGPHLREAALCARASYYPDGLPVGEAVVTPAYELSAHWVIHTVGPQAWQYEGKHHAEGVDLLAQAYRSTLDIATFLNVRTIAFPSISTGAYGWDLNEAVATAVAAVESFLANEDHIFKEVTFVAFDDKTYTAFKQALP